MASNSQSTDEDWSSIHGGVNYYQILGVSLNATKDEVKQAYYKKAKQMHPDRNPHVSENLFKDLTKAYEVLSDKIKRADYNEKLMDDDELAYSNFSEDPIGSLIAGERMSEKWKKLYEEWLQTKNDEGIGKFPNALINNIAEFEKGQFSYLVFTNKEEKHSNDVHDASICDEMMNCVSVAVSQPDVQKVTEQSQRALKKVIRRMQTASGEAPQLAGSLAPILDVSCVSDNDMRTFLSHFVSDDECTQLSKLKHNELIEKMHIFVPHEYIRSPPDSRESTICTKCKHKFMFIFHHSSTCKACGNAFCRKCIPRSVKIPRLGIMKSSPTCDDCLESNAQLDEDRWIELGVASLETGTSETLWQALGCFTVALHCGSSSFKVMSRLATEMLSLSLVEMALPLISTLLQITDYRNEQVSAYLLLSELALKVTKEPNTCWDIKHLFLKLASEACSKAHQVGCFDRDSEIVKRREEIERAFESLNTEMHTMHSIHVADKRESIETAFANRNWDLILDIATEERDDEMIEILKTDSTVDAFCQFLTKKEQHLDEMLQEDRFPLIFIRGLMKLQQGSTKSGLKDIEMAAWSGSQTEWLRKASVQAIAAQMNNTKGYIPYQHVIEACKQLKQHITDFLTKSTSENVCLELLPTPEELDPTAHQSNWPHLYVEGVESKAFTKYEKAIIKSVKQGTFSKIEAGFAYIDLIQACSHFAEVCTCLLYAALWFHKELMEKVSQNGKASEKYALKNLIMFTIQLLQAQSQMRLHPGMQLIMARRALGVALPALKSVGKLATPSDSEVVVGLLRTIVYNCRLCPFWNAPPVSVSEAVLLNIVSGQLHCEYVLSLQYIESEEVLPIHLSELHYQIYENDLRLMAKLSNSNAAHTRAMEEMLKERDLTWEDVSGALSSPLTPCDADGWLTVQSHLGNSPEYSELKGFVFDTDAAKHSLEIMVSHPRFWNKRKGLFSQDDIHAMLQCDLAEIFPIFFSLDQPNPNQHFHPFQQMRYSPESLAGSDALYTLFHTDYLLKSFSVGSEVSSQPPFAQRKCKEGLLASLPPHLHEILTSISERGGSSQSIHRFWIQADELSYDIVQEGSKVEYRLSEPKMTVRSHPLLPGLDGELQDTKDEDDPDSPEAKFAAELTEHYSEISEYFPMFARLKELCKLQFLCFAINVTLRGLKEKSEGNGWEVTDEMMKTLHKSTRDSQRNNIRNILRKCRQDIPSEHRSSSYVVSQMTDSLQGLCKRSVSRSSLEYQVSRWLRNNNYSDLVEMIVSTLPLPTRQEVHQTLLEKFKNDYNGFKSEVIKLKEAAKLNMKSKTQCDWVPAAMQQKINENETSYSLCYGGVIFAPRYVQRQIPKPSSTRIQIQPKNAPSAIRRLFTSGKERESPRYSAPKGPSSLVNNPRRTNHNWNNSSNRDNTNRRNGRDAFLALAAFFMIRKTDDQRKTKDTSQYQKYVPIQTIKDKGRSAFKEGGAKTPRSLVSVLTSERKTETRSCGDKRCKCCQYINQPNTGATEGGGYTCKDRNVIYKITDMQTGMVYIGMTINQLNRRMSGHRSKGTVFDHFNGNFEHMKVEIVKQFPSATPKELRMREMEIIQSFPAEKLINKRK